MLKLNTHQSGSKSGKSLTFLISFFHLFLIPLFLIPSLILITACNKEPEVRKYTESTAGTETTKTAPPATHPMPPHPKSDSRPHFQWTCPDGWTEQTGGSGFRLATFTFQSGKHESMCSIVPLQGEAGGLKANVIRWMGQLGIQADDNSPELKQVLDKQEKFLTAGQYPGTLVDLSPLTTEESGVSIIAAVVTVQGNSVFFKMNGPKSHLLENKDSFKALCQSFAGREKTNQ